ncbi:HIT family protein [archaeon]|jgi:histidine triad (HIT) family protein|nr:HIT family protein [archaeon]MBT6762873.1 HIT family protein [archaeon]MBT7706917.1 HIT family protein [archaeon]
MDSCIFCKIVVGEIPSYKVFEDENFLAFLDITPKKEGHTLVIPKKHYRWVWDVKENYSVTTNKVANALKKAFDTDWVVSFVMGEEVHHAHIHLVPRQRDDGHGSLINVDSKVEINKEEMLEIAQKIRDSF